jgi:membrane protein YqaA with SNARE-associated domain
VYLLLDPRAWLLLVLFSILGVVTSLAVYELGRQGVRALRSRFPRITPEQWDRARELYEKCGSWALLLTALPVAGVVPAAAAGRFGIGLAEFFVWALIGKLVRNWAFLVIVVEVVSLLQQLNSAALPRLWATSNSGAPKAKTGNQCGLRFPPRGPCQSHASV